MAGLIELLLSGMQGNPQLRLGGEDTPAGGGLLDAVGQRIMQQQYNPQMGGAAPLNAPQQAREAPQSAMAAPRVSMPQQGGGGLLGRLFGGQRGPSNGTVQYLMNKGYDQSAAMAIASDPDMLRRVVATVGGPQGAVDPLEAAYKQAQIDNMRSQIDERNRASTGDARKTYGNEVIWGQREDGTWAAMRTASDGSLIEAPTDKNLKLVPPGVASMDLGTRIAVRDRSGKIIGYEDKDLAGAAEQTAAGKAKGEDVGSYESLSSKMPGLEKVVTDLDKLANDATYTKAGVAYDAITRQMGMEPREAAVARAKYIAMVDNQVLPLLRDTFGAQFTVQEGESLRATLGNPDLSPPEKQEVLKAFIEQKRRDVEALGRRTGSLPGAERMGTAGEWTDMGNGVRVRRQGQ